jgi:hypothetical protein
VADWVSAYAQQIDDGPPPALGFTIDTHLAAMEDIARNSRHPVATWTWT